MENNAINESVANQILRSPPRRRRSTFFERRESIVPQPQYEDLDHHESIKQTDVSSNHQEELTRYYDNLLKEKEEWKKEVNNRKHKYHDLRQQCQIAAKASSSSSISYSSLKNEDIEFLKGKPNISKLLESQSKLYQSVKETRALFRKANELDDVLLIHCEKKVNRITEHILENSSIEP